MNRRSYNRVKIFGATICIDVADARQCRKAFLHIKDIGLLRHKWFLNPYGYAVRNMTPAECVMYEVSTRRPIFMHREVLGLRYKDGILVDHINQRTLDNRPCNLRVATKSVNAFNSKVRRDSVTGIRGVSLHRATGKFRAYIRLNGVDQHLGLFGSIAEAQDARTKRAQEVVGVK